jgi:3-hydroxyisobutyrate dehydrogenase
MHKTALLGLGVMGAGMAANLLDGGVPLAVWNRSRAKAEPFAARGARVAPTPRAAVEGADVVIAMLGDDAASRAVWLGADGGALGAVGRGAVLVESSTLSVDWVKELASQAAARGAALLDAPVGGSKDAAEEGKLALFVGGDAAALERARPVLERISQKIVHLGPTGSGALMKLVNNQMAAVQAAALAEGLALAEKAGLDMGKAVAILINGGPGSPVVKGKAARMRNADYADTQFALRWMHKDMTYALRLADEHGVPMPTLAAARELFRAARTLGYDDADWSAVMEAARQGAGSRRRP